MTAAGWVPWSKTGWRGSLGISVVLLALSRWSAGGGARGRMKARLLKQVADNETLETMPAQVTGEDVLRFLNKGVVDARTAYHDLVKSNKEGEDLNINEAQERKDELDGHPERKRKEGRKRWSSGTDHTREAEKWKTRNDELQIVQNKLEENREKDPQMEAVLHERIAIAEQLCDAFLSAYSPVNQRDGKTGPASKSDTESKAKPKIREKLVRRNPLLETKEYVARVKKERIERQEKMLRDLGEELLYKEKNASSWSPKFWCWYYSGYLLDGLVITLLIFFIRQVVFQLVVECVLFNQHGGAVLCTGGFWEDWVTGK